MNANLTERQQKWFASVKASLERDTGKSLIQWAEIVREQCPETAPRARQKWLKDTYGLGQNRAVQILDAAFPLAEADTPEAQRRTLWADPASAAILVAIETAIADLPEVTRTQRKAYTAFSREVQFAAIRPLRGGKAQLGLAIAPESDPVLSPAQREPWSERLTSTVTLETTDDASPQASAWLRAAWSTA